MTGRAPDTSFEIPGASVHLEARRLSVQHLLDGYRTTLTMSRGLGRVQIEIYFTLPLPEKRWVLVSDLYGPDATPARAESVRRAVRSLAARGLVEVSWTNRRPGSGAGARTRRVRLALTPQERAEEMRRIEEMNASFSALLSGQMPHDALGLRIPREPHE